MSIFNSKAIVAFLFLFILASSVGAQNQSAAGSDNSEFNKATSVAQEKLDASIAELNSIRAKASEEIIPLSRELTELESELSEVRGEFQQTTRLLDSRSLDLSNLTSEIKTRKTESSYLSTLFSEYIRNLESRLHIAELHRYEDAIEAAKLAPENSNLTDEQVYQEQSKVLDTSLERLEELLGGASFEGTAVDPEGRIQNGEFLLFGPAALFRSNDGTIAGTAEQRLGSLEPAVIPFGNERDTLAALSVVESRQGMFPFDPTQGNAHKVEETEETFAEHVSKGGPVMIPIFLLAGISMLVALFKFLTFMAVRHPSKQSMKAFLHAVSNERIEGVQEKLKAIKSPPIWSPSYYVTGAIIGGVLGYIMSFIVTFKIASELVPGFVSFAESVSFPVFLVIFILGGAAVNFLVRFVLGYSAVGVMLEAATEHFEYPTELIEEVMFEKILAIRLRLESMLPLIAISAAAAPLLGLLGTVTGIINTFKLITVFGSGDVKTLSGGISEALITTEFGLIAAIPALLLHAFLARRSRSMVNEMERAGVSLINELGKKPKNSIGAPSIPSNLGNDLTSRANVDRLSSHFGVSKLSPEAMSSNSETKVQKTESASAKPDSENKNSNDDSDEDDRVLVGAGSDKE